MNEKTYSNGDEDGLSKGRESKLKSMREMPIEHDLMWMMETAGVETDVTKYDIDNHGPCITIEEDVKLTDNINYALNAINSKEIDAPAKHSMFVLSGCSNVKNCPVCGVSLSH